MEEDASEVGGNWSLHRQHLEGAKGKDYEHRSICCMVYLSMVISLGLCLSQGHLLFCFPSSCF